MNLPLLSRWTAAVFLGLVWAHAASCGNPARSGGKQLIPESPPPSAVLPSDDGELQPSMSRLRGADGLVLADVDTCGGCHAEVFAQQQSSSHAYSSFNNPVYRASVDRLRDEVGKPASRMCGGCHDIALLADGAMNGDVAPTDERAHAGVTCRVCHGIEAINRSGNGSYALSQRAMVFPTDGDPASVEAHKRAVAPLRTADMCGSCHRSFLNDSTGNQDVFLSGQDDLGAWQGSAYNHAGLGRIDDPVAKQDCIACHMPKVVAPHGDAAAVDGKISSHRFAGGHTWLAQMLGDEPQMAAHREALRGAVTLDWAGITAADGTRSFPPSVAKPTAGETLVAELVVRNTRVGHRFPAGVLDAQDTWIEVELVDDRGRVLSHAGQAHADGHEDLSAHVLRSLVADENGELRFRREVHAFRAPIVNHTIAARDVAAVRYRFQMPAGQDGPFELRARLIHRSRNRMLQTDACDAFRSPRGQAFARRAVQLGDPVLDPCAAQPTTVVATAVTHLDRNGTLAVADWRKLYELGLGLLHARQEHVQDAREPLERALALVAADPAAEPRHRAAVLHALGRLAGIEGRADDAGRLFDRADALAPGHPAIAYARGEALARVWRWKEASTAFAAASAKAGDNATGWAKLAMALGSQGREREALDAAQLGLALAPRHADLLRVQALALASLGVPDNDAALALEAYDRHRSPDRGAQLRFVCANRDRMCELERDPVHAHDLVPVRPRPAP